VGKRLLQILDRVYGLGTNFKYKDDEDGDNDNNNIIITRQFVRCHNMASHYKGAVQRPLPGARTKLNKKLHCRKEAARCFVFVSS